MRRLTIVSKLAGIVAGLVAPPAVLYTVAGNPLPGWPIDWRLVGDSLSTGAIATSTWLQVVAVGAWLVWGYLIVAVALEMVATVRGRPSRVRAAAVQWLASTIVALATQLATVNATVSPVTPIHSVAASEHTAPAAAETLYSVAADGMRLIVATEGDSWAGFAASAVGDAAVGSDIRALNRGRDVGGHVLDGSEAFVEAGWRLAVPAGATSTSDAAYGTTDTDVDATVTTPSAEAADEESWTVREGDHFWGIAERTLGQAWGRSPTDPEIVAYWEQLIETNRGRLAPPGDPDLIYPGQQFVVPPTPAVTDAVEAPDTGLGPAGTPPSARERPVPHDPPDDLPPPDDVPHAEAPDDPEPTQPPAADVHTPERTLDDPENRAADASDQGVSPDEVEVEVEAGLTGWGIPVGLTAGTAATMLLAGGVLTLLRRRRRLALQQRRVQVRLPPLTPDQLDQAGRLEAAAPPDGVLDELADLLSSIPTTAAPVLVQVRDDGSVDLMFDPDQQVAMPPPAPWAAHKDPAGGQPQWTATLGARGPRRSIGLPLLVTLGRHGTTTMLANVAAMPLLDVTADDASAVRRRLRAFALEAATSCTAGPLHVTVAGDPGWNDGERVRLIDDPEAEVAAGADEVAQSIIAEDRLPRLIICHDPADVPHLPAGLDLIGVIAAGGTRTVGGWRLHLDGTCGVLHRPDGVQVTLDNPDFDPDLVTDELASLDASLSAATVTNPPADPTGDDAAAVPAADTGPPEEHAAEPTGETRPVPGWCQVGLLGRVTVTCGDTPIDTLGPIVGQVLVYLATHPDTTSELLEDAVWSGQAAGAGHRVRSALTRLRAELGTTVDGEPLIPRRSPREQTIRLSPEVTTDLDRAFAHLDASERTDGHERLDQLLAALELVRGTPFENLPVSWATDIAHRAVARLQDAALDAARQLLAAGRLDDAEHAVAQGLKLCDPSEPLYVVWAQIEDARDRRHRIPQLWTRLRQRYADEADETFDTPTTPTAATQRAFAALTGRDDGHP